MGRKNTIILVSGFKRAGKDFVSEQLNKFLKGSVTYSLANPLKDIIATTLDVTREQLDTFKNNAEMLWTIDMNGESSKITDFRSILQIFGTEAMKNYFGNDVWTNLFIDQDYQKDYIIISDWRFTEEFSRISEVYDKVITIRVEDKNIVNADMHASEIALVDFDFDIVIDNTAKDSTVIDVIKSLTPLLKKGNI